MLGLVLIMLPLFQSPSSASCVHLPQGDLTPMCQRHSLLSLPVCSPCWYSAVTHRHCWSPSSLWLFCCQLQHCVEKRGASIRDHIIFTREHCCSIWHSPLVLYWRFHVSEGRFIALVLPLAVIMADIGRGCFGSAVRSPAILNI